MDKVQNPSNSVQPRSLVNLSLRDSAVRRKPMTFVNCRSAVTMKESRTHVEYLRIQSESTVDSFCENVHTDNTTLTLLQHVSRMTIRTEQKNVWQEETGGQ
jgi:hypothetical protein